MLPPPCSHQAFPKKSPALPCWGAGGGRAPRCCLCWSCSSSAYCNSTHTGCPKCPLPLQDTSPERALVLHAHPALKTSPDTTDLVLELSRQPIPPLGFLCGCPPDGAAGALLLMLWCCFRAWGPRNKARLGRARLGPSSWDPTGLALPPAAQGFPALHYHPQITTNTVYLPRGLGKATAQLFSSQEPEESVKNVTSQAITNGEL